MIIDIKEIQRQMVKNMEVKGRFSYNYIDLSKLLSILTSHNIIASVSLFMNKDDSSCKCDVVIINAKDMSSILEKSLTLSVDLSDNNPQSTGKIMTYMRRYAIMSTLGIHPMNEDDDCISLLNKPTPSKDKCPCPKDKCYCSNDKAADFEVVSRCPLTRYK